MNQTILRGALALAIAAPVLMAQPKPKSAGEIEAIKAMYSANDPDGRIAAAENLLTKYADTQFKGVALMMEADAYERKHDFEHTIVFGERAVEADPKNYQAMLLLAQNIAQHTKEFDLDRDESLAKVDKYAKGALDILKDAPKPNQNLTDGQWAAAKHDLESQAHVSMGMANMVRKKPDAAEADFQAAMAGSDKPDAAIQVRLGMAYREDGKYDDAIATFDKVMATPDVNPQVRQVAQAERVRTIQKKGGPAKPAAPAAGTATGTGAAAPANPPAAPPAPANPPTPPKQ